MIAHGLGGLGQLQVDGVAHAARGGLGHGFQGGDAVGALSGGDELAKGLFALFALAFLIDADQGIAAGHRQNNDNHGDGLLPVLMGRRSNRGMSARLFLPGVGADTSDM
jgi:hypothetical protein